MSVSDDIAIIEFPIKFTTDAQNIDEVKAQMDDIAGETTTSDEDAVALLQSEEDEEQSEAMNKLLDFINTTDKQGLQTLSKFAKNHTSMMKGELMGMLGKAGIHGAVAAAIIAMILGSPEFIMTLTRALAVKGGPLNQDFRRDLANESQLGFTREQQYRRAAGFDVIITNDERGFLLTEPFSVGNSLIDIDSTRTQRLSSNNTHYGYVAGMGS